MADRLENEHKVNTAGSPEDPITMAINALQRIADLDPTRDLGYHDEWAEAELFTEAQNIATEALKQFHLHTHGNNITEHVCHTQCCSHPAHHKDKGE